MRILTPFFILIFIAFIGCGGDQTDSVDQQPVNSNLGMLKGIELNNGEKWVVNDETEEGMASIKNMLDGFQARGGTEYPQLAQQLRKQSDRILKFADPKLESYGQLNLLILPLIKSINKILRSESPERGQASIAELETILRTYYANFQAQR